MCFSFVTIKSTDGAAATYICQYLYRLDQMEKRMAELHMLV